MTHDEIFILVDEPATSAFLLEASNEILIIVVIALVTGFAVGQGGGTFAALLGLMVISVISSILVVRRLQAWYTRYALTDFRLIRSWGVVKRQLAWIPWSKVTDVLLVQTLAGRILGYATVRIESANEASGFKAVTDLRDPHRFHRVVTEMVQAKQGKTVPPWMKPDNPTGTGTGGGGGPRPPRPHPDEAVTVPGLPAIPMPDDGGDPFGD
ncbi:MAG TPA: PH domain-containing protein [Acidimicrobiia bacterium]|nr:PH domain-containing protein [Acidimicrobiia bacterium]